MSKKKITKQCESCGCVAELNESKEEIVNDTKDWDKFEHDHTEETVEILKTPWLIEKIFGKTKVTTTKEFYKYEIIQLRRTNRTHKCPVCKHHNFLENLSEERVCTGKFYAPRVLSEEVSYR